MRIWLLFVVVPTLVASHRYVRPLPIGMTFEGVTGNSMTSESVVKCVDAWAADPPKALVFNEKSKSCTAFSKVYGTKEAPADERGYLVTVSDKDICFKNAMEDVSKISECREEWTQLSFLSTFACYLLMDKVGLEYSLHEQYLLCEQRYPYSKAASVHSAEEDAALDRQYPNTYINLSLMLEDPTKYRDMTAWKWFDGTEFDYHNFRFESLDSQNGSGPLRNALFLGEGWWTADHEELRNLRKLLCKYVPS